MIITVTLNPALDKTMTMPAFAVNTVNRVENIRMDPGGKGINVSKAIKALGGKTLAMGILGGSTGSYLKRALDSMEIPNDMVFSQDPTRVNIKIVDPILKTVTDLNEPGRTISGDLLQEVWEKLNAAAKPGDTVVLAGKNPPGVDDRELANWVRQLKEMGICVCVDTVGEPMRLALQEGPAIVKPNRAELSEILGTHLVSEMQILEAGRELVSMGVGLAVISMGAQGAIFVTREQALYARCPKVEVRSTVGAGDSMMAALAHYTASGCSLEEIARRAVSVGSACVMCNGSQCAELDKILPLIEHVRIEHL